MNLFICVFLSVVLSGLVGSRVLQQIESRLNTINSDIRDMSTAEQGLVKAQVCVCMCDFSFNNHSNIMRILESPHYNYNDNSTEKQYHWNHDFPADE